ncbi:TonB-dependent receptor [Alteromonas oceanisediminis]|uniref:TonB-dependent receptor n=1 Tax=Alteromonas oceanisediminis TaxID=2836180 RepID=UPI001BDA744F|nr:TonB-dependent receptor [Alteromonas oceanisediminis]MBT0585919.1 carboxypeptidase regulatory-like domain-containing protein [Alteromonas oceanisediminis]
MLFKSKLSRVAIAVAMTAGLSSVAMAQETTSGISGTVLTESGSVVAGATIRITDMRNGSTRTIESNNTGRYNLRGLQVGGPYTIEVTDESGSRTINDVFLTLGETLPLNVGLEAQNVERIAVTGAVVNSSYGSDGPVANFGLFDLENAPAVNRDIKDLIRIDPRIYINEARDDGIQCVGQNSRFNSFTLDGVRTNDNFGLNSNGYPTIRQPFSYDAIEQVAVELAPFDVQYGGFTACNINAVTKSGGNEFKGSAFYDYTSDSFRGDSLEGQELELGEFSEKRYGFNVGGKLIEDKLFFFVAYEKLDGASLFDRGAADSNAAVPVQGVSQAQLDEIRQIANDLYNYDPGAEVRSIPVEDEKITLKLDWNIADNHRASLIYNNNDGDIIRESDGDADEYEFSNHYYRQRGEFESYVGSVFSDWTDSFSTEVRIGSADFEAAVTPLGGTDFGEVQINTENNGAEAVVYLGADDSRHANKLTYTNDTFKVAGTYLMGDHVITGGYEWETLDVFNLFIQEAEGEYRFESIDDFRAGTPSRITYENASPSNNPAEAAAEFSYDINSLYVQDEYYWLDQDMSITFGVRYDWYSSDDLPPLNASFQEAYGFSNQQNLDGLDLLQPRLGINWQFNESWELRGGIGLYSGGNPNVWLSNNFSNNGIIQQEVQDRSGRSVFDLAFNGGGQPVYDIPQELFDAVAAGDGRTGGINAQDPNFEIPSEWKYALGATYTFENDMIFMMDYLFTDKQDAAIIQDLSRVNVGTAPDGRPIYDSTNGRRQDFVLTNVEGDSGQTTSISLSLSQQMDNGFRWAASYAYTDAEDVSPMTSSVAFSNYFNSAVSDTENPGPATSNYEIPHRFTLNLNYTTEFFPGYDTSFTVFGTINEGRPYSFVFDGDPGFGSTAGFISNNLVYIPETDDPTVIYGPDFDLAAFNSFIDEQGLARGEIMSRNSVNSAWWTKFDVRISQDFAGFMEGHRGQVFLNIENFGNLLNDDWGILEEASFPRSQRVVDASINDNGQYVYSDFITPSLETRVAEASLWQVRLGVRYSF